MNATRRQQLGRIADRIEEIKSLVEELQADEQEAYDNLPEQIRHSQRGEQMYDFIRTMDDIAADLQKSIDNIDQIINA